jgi:acylphosphatase
VRDSAHRLQLAGWVRNCPDGTVEVAAEGTDEARDTLLASLRLGPAGAEVEEIVQLSMDHIEPPLTAPFRILF